MRLELRIILITGDFNFPNINWNHTVTISPEDRFQEAIHDAFLTQMINEPTRHRMNQISNVLDLFFCNDDYFINSIEQLAPIGKSDHNVIRISFDLSGR